MIYGIALLLLLGVGGLGFWFARENLGFGGMTLFNAKQRRLGLVETTAVDGRRRLLLVRRDNVEHLILTGGPVDVLLETGISWNPRPTLLGLDQSGPNGLGAAEPRLSEETPIVLSRDQAN